MDTALMALMLLLLLLSSLFSGSEAALFSLSRLQIHRLRERRDRNSRRIMALLDEPERTLAALLVGNNLVNIALSSVATAFCLALISDRSKAIEISTIGVILAVLLLGETTPKTLAVNHPEGTARLVAGGLRSARALLQPVTRFMHGLAVLVLRALGGSETAAPAAGLISRAELHAVLEDVDEETAVITRHESRMVQNILDFSRRTAEQIMTPRVDVDDLDVVHPAEAMAAFLRQARHSRYPVFEGDPDNILGFIAGKEFLLSRDRDVRELLRPVIFFPDSAPVDHIFAEMQRRRIPMVIVVNEYGETVGLITREDVVEEIVGDIYDEFDLEDAPIRKKGEGLYIVHGRSDLSDLNDELALDLPDESAVTLNGFLCEVYGRIPRPGTVVAWHDLRFHVLEVARHQVRKVLLEIPGAKPGDAP